ncbi:hypothetical protein HDU96_001074 [Phlyctochytrium bullatum]|nr:hypothetical protein HDU96_001074 [Phlyctochytrium bullatum]
MTPVLIVFSGAGDDSVAVAVAIAARQENRVLGFAHQTPICRREPHVEQSSSRRQCSRMAAVSNSSIDDSGSLPPFVRMTDIEEMEFWYAGPGAEIVDPDPIPSPECAVIHALPSVTTSVSAFLKQPKFLNKAATPTEPSRKSALLPLPLAALSEPSEAPLMPEILSRISAIAQGSTLPPLSEVLPMTRPPPTTRRQLTGTVGITTTLAASPTNTQVVPPVTTTIQLAALEASDPEGVGVTAAVAIITATSIASALLFSLGIFVVWTYRQKWAKGKEGVQVQPQANGADAAARPEGTPSHDHLDGAAGNVSPNRHADGVLPAADDDSLRSSSFDGNELLVDPNGKLDASASTQLVVIMPGSGTSQSGSQSVSSQSRSDVLSWSSADVQRWMDSIGFRTEVVEMFKAHNIDGPRLLGLTDNILENEIGIASAALRASILSVRARFFLQPRLPADAVANGGPSATPRRSRGGPNPAASEGSSTEDPEAGVMRTIVSSAAFVNEAMDGQADDSTRLGSRRGSEPPPAYGIRRRASAMYFITYPEIERDMDK